MMSLLSLIFRNDNHISLCIDEEKKKGNTMDQSYSANIALPALLEFVK